MVSRMVRFVAAGFASVARIAESSADFDAFIQKHDRQYKSGSQEYEYRRAVFQGRAAEVQALNARPQRLWEAGLNHFSDRSSEEFSRVLGYRRHVRPVHREREVASLLTISDDEREEASLLLSNKTQAEPAEKDWTHLQSIRRIRDQGDCGSCWAFAAITSLEAHMEIHKHDNAPLSVQQLVSCTPNEYHCGGTGGCDGATAELAFEYALRQGLVASQNLPYTAEDDECPRSLRSEHHGFLGSRLFRARSGLRGMVGWETLPQNELQPLKRALVDFGPVAISVAAGQSWMHYDSGIHDDCVKDAIIDHAVVLVGYGGKHKKYWKIQNSWSEDWGEEGRIRILRREDAEEAAFCGVDKDPLLGNACALGPKKAQKGEKWPVCGACGLLSDASVPRFQ